jgi:hypothetical protein
MKTFCQATLAAIKRLGINIKDIPTTSIKK